MEEAKTIISGSRVYRPLLDETLITEDLRVAREELNETPETREVALRVLRTMLAASDKSYPKCFTRAILMREFNEKKPQN
ncbi:hypothetical protein NPIL_291101 [Nephila pilipes]|uniref:Uncharacterized protein n=1 Tax=Nephila pilipes TaxID=299642 RepID=A0A8X6NE80_NEPPI|nr:hypothetical protein NPIL_291101 [Nephila pilipes]